MSNEEEERSGEEESEEEEEEEQPHREEQPQKEEQPHKEEQPQWKERPQPEQPAAEPIWTNLESKTRKYKTLTEKAKEFKELSDIVGGHEAVQSFLKNYAGTKEEKNGAEAGKDLLKDHKIDTSIRDRSKDGIGLPTAPQGYGAAYLNENWSMGQVSQLDNPVTLKKEDWQMIADANRIFHGFVITKMGTLTRARFPAFELKTNPGSQEGIPDFEVFDSSSISIKETNSAFERSMAENGFTSEAIEASLSGGYGGVSVGVSGGVGTQSETGTAKGDFASYQAYTAAYTFPRARIFLDRYNLKIHYRCAKKLYALRDLVKKIQDNLDSDNEADTDDAVKNALAARNEFLTEYGYIFATTFSLGGQLVATKSADSIASKTDTQKRDAMKKSAAVSVSSSFAGGSISYNKETQTDTKTQESSTSNTSSLAWSATGGNTLLCANPPEWANSVAGCSTWRVVGQESVSTIPQLISTLKDDQESLIWPDINDVFKLLRENAYKTLPKKPHGTWEGLFKLEALDGRKIISKNGQLQLVSNLGSEKEVVFTMINADINNKDAVPKLPLCYEDSPVFLVTTGEPARDPHQGNQIPGIWVDENKNIRSETVSSSNTICRWSLRKVSAPRNFKDAWNPKQTTLSDNQEVQLFCHSVGIGAFREAGHAPYWAPAVGVGPGEPADLRVLVVDHQVLNPVWATHIKAFGLMQSVEQVASANFNLTSNDLGFFSRFQQDRIFYPGIPQTSAIDMDYKTLLATVRDYDWGRATTEQLASIQGLAKIVGAGDDKVGGEVYSRMVNVFASGPDNQVLRNAVRDVYTNVGAREISYRTQLPRVLGFEEVKFRLRYVTS